MSISRFLVIGYGGSGRREAKCMRELLPDCTIKVWDTSSRKKKDLNEYDIVSSLDEALSFAPEGIFVGTPSSTHLDYAESFLGKARFIIIDKPLDAELNRCEVFARNCRMTNTKVYVNFQRRFLPCWQGLKNALSRHNDGAFCYGAIRIQSYYPAWRPEKPADQLYAARRDLGGGVLLTECHEIDLLNWLLGPVSRVSACIEEPTTENGVENHAQLMMDISLPNGSYPVSLLLDDLSTVECRSMELKFAKALYRIDELSGSVVRLCPDGHSEQVIQEQVAPFMPHKVLLKKVLAEDAGIHQADLPQLTDGLMVNAVVHAAKTSALNGKQCVVACTVCPAEGAPYLEAAIQRLQDIFQNRLIAVYGLGSLGYGGYVDGWSDFDIDVLIDTSYDQARTDYETGKRIEREIKEMGFDRIDIRVYNLDHLNARNTILTYGQCSRASMLCDSALLLAGKDIRHKIRRPTTLECNREALGLLEKMLQNPDEWWNGLPWDDIAAHFALVARFLYTRDFGKVAGKQTALEYFLSDNECHIPDYALQWILWALACRINHHPMMIQNRLHAEAVRTLRELFRWAREKMKEAVI